MVATLPLAHVSWHFPLVITFRMLGNLWFLTSAPSPELSRFALGSPCPSTVQEDLAHWSMWNNAFEMKGLRISAFWGALVPNEGSFLDFVVVVLALFSLLQQIHACIEYPMRAFYVQNAEFGHNGEQNRYVPDLMEPTVYRETHTGWCHSSQWVFMEHLPCARLSARGWGHPGAQRWPTINHITTQVNREWHITCLSYEGRAGGALKAMTPGCDLFWLGVWGERGVSVKEGFPEEATLEGSSEGWLGVNQAKGEKSFL